MTHDAFYVAPHIVIAALYLLLARHVWLSLSDGDAVALRGAPAARAGLDRWALPVLALGHGVLLAALVFGGGEFRFGFALALSATLWLTVLILWLEGFFVPLRGLQPIVLPAAAVALVLPLVFPGVVLQAAERGLPLRLHLLVAILAYSLLTIAALHAVLMAALDRQLHAGAAGESQAVSRLFRQAPSLLAMERLLFRLIGAGFVLLTATVLSGVLFSEYLFGRALRFEHKTVFALAAWLVFGGLLAGRVVFGWRGRVALRWTLAGFTMLLLAYVGSRFVIEVILSRMG
jgi:ABC-type uncharacterized transport system permease subunit